MKIVSSMGALYRLSERNYRKLLRLAAADEPYNLALLGTRIGTLDLNVTDLSPEEAAGTLEELREN
jgi:hypothetical protein